MPRKRALSNGIAAAPVKVEPQSPSKALQNGTSPSRSTRSTRTAKKTKAESPDASTADMHGIPIATGQIEDVVAKKEENVDEDVLPKTPARKTSTRTRSNKKVKLEDDNAAKREEDDEDDDEKPMPTPKSIMAATPSSSTLTKKLKQLEQYLQTPFPDHPYPTPEQCQQVQDSLAEVHGLPKRPKKLVDKEGGAAGCGAVPDVLDALVRTILSQNTTSANSTRAKNAMDAKYGRANYAAVYRASQEDLAETIACGGLANVKAKVIKKVLNQLVAKHMEADPLLKEEKLTHISLDYLHGLSDLDAMKELVSFDGVGPKTASCVLLFCLGRDSFAVDTHVFRITKALGWTPSKANRETAFQHLDVRIPAENKYALHALLVRHGRSCRSCSANGNITDPEVDSAKCPIKKYLKEARSLSSSRSKNKKEQEEDDGEELAGTLPKDIKDEEASADEK